MNDKRKSSSGRKEGGHCDPPLVLFCLCATCAVGGAVWKQAHVDVRTTPVPLGIVQCSAMHFTTELTALQHDYLCTDYLLHGTLCGIDVYRSYLRVLVSSLSHEEVMPCREKPRNRPWLNSSREVQQQRPTRGLFFNRRASTFDDPCPILVQHDARDRCTVQARHKSWVWVQQGIPIPKVIFHHSDVLHHHPTDKTRQS